ncbi:cysteine desulfurase [Rhodobacter aestuarii]|uniref:Cysteine desulfurase n=1 Tax=Rhodobacter aestuarii TaxID=453582 RepID=A0A1N7NT05_9RHOB|nr:cysteine desulfurase NifS [Rhodobacter aestuarii]PTV94570.1 cysteine desulfurase [Rhodobacter aestuarii]SIT01447.1 cysteine desulfurase [Rhodobacter aestuarii]
MTNAARIYLDNNATTRVVEEAVAAMLPLYTEEYGNPSSAHAFGAAAGKGMRAARKAMQGLIGAESEAEIIFTSGGTEANTTAIRSALAVQEGRREVIISTVEHPAILQLCDALEKYEGVKVQRIPVDAQGRLEIEAYRAALSDRVAVVSFMWANNETGVIFPVEGLAELAHEFGALFHTDAVQAAGKTPISVKGTAIDMLSLSAHKFHGPKGVGVLYLKKGVAFQPLLRGGKQERGRRAGTENAPAVTGAGVAAEIAAARLADDAPRIAALRDRLEAGILNTISHCTVLGAPRDRVPNTLCIAFDLVEGEGIVMKLDRAGIAASTGSACASGAVEPSHVVRAMGVPFTAAHGVVRFSISRFTTEDEIDRLLETLPAIVADLRALSPFWSENGPNLPGQMPAAQ